MASTDCEAIINNVYKDELTVTYDAPKPSKKVFDKQDLFNADLFSFGSMIGSITNKGTNAYALLPLLEEEYGKDSKEVKLVLSRLQQCCVAQSKQIDRAKIGQPVKGIPDIWVRRRRITEEDDEATRAYKELMNRCLIDKRPYFFKYRYADSKREHDAYKKSRDAICKSLFDLSIDELIAASRKTQEQREWLRNYHEFAPLIESNSPMNLLCKYIEQIDFQIVKKMRAPGQFDPCVYIDQTIVNWKEHYESIVKCYDRHLRDVANNAACGNFEEERIIDKLRESMSFICTNPTVVANCLVQYLLIDKPRKDIEILWLAYGNQLVRNARKSDQGIVVFPLPDPNGEIEYLGDRFQNVEVTEYKLGI